MTALPIEYYLSSMDMDRTFMINSNPMIITRQIPARKGGKSQLDSWTVGQKDHPNGRCYMESQNNPEGMTENSPG